MAEDKAVAAVEDKAEEGKAEEGKVEEGKVEEDKAAVDIVVVHPQDSLVVAAAVLHRNNLGSLFVLSYYYTASQPYSTRRSGEGSRELYL